jgi:hypothetical protein
MTTYQDVVQANLAALAFACTEASGDLVPYIGAGNFVATGVSDYRQPGPIGTDFAVNLHVGAKFTYTFSQGLVPPVTTEVWVKLSTVTPASNTRIWSTGTDTANGIEFYVTTTGHLHLTGPGQFDQDIGLVWPDTNWHLLQLASVTNGAVRSVGFDGVVRYQANPGTANAESPHIWTLGGSAGVTETSPTEFAWPAFYLYAMDAANMAATFVAITDPAGALGGTVTGGSSAPGGNSAILAEILAAVKKTY